MIEKFTTKTSINTRGEAIRFANECYEVAEEFAIGFGEYLDSLLESQIRSFTIKEILEIYKKTL